MQAIRIKTRIDSETLYLPQLRPLVGKKVEIIVLEEESAALAGNQNAEQERYALQGSVLRYDDPFEPVAEEDWEALG